MVAQKWLQNDFAKSAEEIILRTAAFNDKNPTREELFFPHHLQRISHFVFFTGLPHYLSESQPCRKQILYLCRRNLCSVSYLLPFFFLFFLRQQIFRNSEGLDNKFSRLYRPMISDIGLCYFCIFVWKWTLFEEREIYLV